MADTGKLVARIRRRMFLRRATDRVQHDALFLVAAILLAATVLRLTGRHVDPWTWLAYSGLALALLALVSMGRTHVSARQAAAEADRILRSRERISTALALGEGRAEDPLGFGDTIHREAEHAASLARSADLRAALPLRARWRSAFTMALLLGILLVPLLPIPQAEARTAESAALKKEKEEVQEALRRLDRQIGRMEEIARRKKQGELEKLAKQIRQEAARLAQERPSRAKAIARTAELERTARKEARRFAGLPPVESDEDLAATDRELKELAEAIRNFMDSAPADLARKFSALAEKIQAGGMDSLTPEELRSMGETVKAMKEALKALEEKLGEDAEARKRLGDLYSPEQMKRMQEALEKIRKAMESGDLDPEDLKRLAEQMRNYRQLQPTPEQIEAMLKALEELAKMIEAGEKLGQCKGGMGGMIPIPGLGGMGGMPGLPGGGAGSGQRGDGNDTGGSGTGRGGDPGTRKNDRGTRPELDPSKVGDQGTATFIRNVRRLPSPDSDPTEYGELIREASREAEEAIRQGDIPRRYRGYVRRYFDAPEEK